MYGMQRDDVQHQLAVGMKESQAFETVNNRLEDQIEQKDRAAAGARDSCCVLHGCPLRPYAAIAQCFLVLRSECACCGFC